MGPTRFTVWGAMRIFCTRTYSGSIYYTGQKVTSKKEAHDIDFHNFTQELPSDINEEPQKPDEGKDLQYRDENFFYVLL